MLFVTTHSGKREPRSAPTEAASPRGAWQGKKAVWHPVSVTKHCAALRGDCAQGSGDSKDQMAHQRTHTGTKKYACSRESCSRAFGQAGDLKKHLRTHTGEKPFVCRHVGCGRAFGCSGHLARHRYVHAGQKKFVCPCEGCAYACIQSIDLKRHLRVHAGKKPFVCSHEGCGRVFRQSTHLIQHLRVHSGEKPFACSWKGCGRVFRQTAHLTQHLRVHSGEKPFACSWKGCRRAFGRFENLEKHWCIHSGGKKPGRKKPGRKKPGAKKPGAKKRVDLKEASTNMSVSSGGSCEGHFSGRDRAGCSRRLEVGQGPTGRPRRPEPSLSVQNERSYPFCIAAGAGSGVPVDAGPAADQDHQSTGCGHDSPCSTTTVWSAGQQRPGGNATPDEEKQLSQWGDWPSSSLLQSLEFAGLETMIAQDVDISDWLTSWAAENPCSPFCSQRGTGACDPDAPVLPLSDDDKAFWQELISPPDSDTWRAVF